MKLLKTILIIIMIFVWVDVYFHFSFSKPKFSQTNIHLRNLEKKMVDMLEIHYDYQLMIEERPNHIMYNDWVKNSKKIMKEFEKLDNERQQYFEDLKCTKQ